MMLRRREHFFSVLTSQICFWLTANKLNLFHLKKKPVVQVHPNYYTTCSTTICTNKIFISASQICYTETY